MSTVTPSAPTLHSFVLWAPDNEGVLAKRLSIRQQHLDNVNRLIAQKILRVGGGFMMPESVGAEAADRKFVGSCVIYEAANIDVVRRIVEEDVYYKEGVWDKEKLVILPIAMATPFN
ncbi:hypothetical protein BV22DRAFT_1015458 [Leucogyrophana mollusca]|uniref:Uncharacterized protein n=1 Tax=Leucogyrophana mollusca TaxID=85980 RepID=A0ACB8BE08_9AGAM|nr:hypothetical protein BV22DRAFT_1015458 [Leucogyrophana mollusca]